MMQKNDVEDEKNNYEEVEDGFEALMTLKAVTPPMDKFFDYLLNNYVTPESRFPPEIWADRSFDGPRTTNCCESFHSKFNAEFTAAHPNIFAFIEGLKKTQAITYIKLRSQNMAIKRREEVEKETALKKAAEEFEDGNTRDRKISEEGLPQIPTCNINFAFSFRIVYFFLHSHHSLIFISNPNYILNRVLYSFKPITNAGEYSDNGKILAEGIHVAILVSGGNSAAGLFHKHYCGIRTYNML